MLFGIPCLKEKEKEKVIEDMQRCNYYHVQNAFSSKFQLSMTIFHYKNARM